MVISFIILNTRRLYREVYEGIGYSIEASIVILNARCSLAFNAPILHTNGLQSNDTYYL
jgi:hypothetical protein